MLHLINNNPIKHSPIGHMLPTLGKKEEGLILEDDEPEKSPFPFLHLFDPVLDPVLGKRKSPLKPHELPGALFTLGGSLVNVNVESCGNVEGLMSVLTFIPPFRHALYANAIADGATNFVTGALYASYVQCTDFYDNVKAGELSKFEFFGALMGMCVQAAIYGMYGLFVIPLVAFKLSTIKAKKQ